MEPQTHTPTGPNSVATVLRSWSGSFLLFACLLALFLILSWTLLLPRLTGVTVQGMVLTAASGERVVQRVADEVRNLEGKRHAFILPARDAAYRAGREEGGAAPSFIDIRSAITFAIAQAPEGHAISITSLTYDVRTRTAHVIGVVSDVGPKSISVLASFIDVLTTLENVESVSPSAFQRVDDPRRGIISPFDIQVTFRPSAAADAF